MNLYTQSCENATIILTNCGSDSDAKKLKWRDNRVLGVNSPTDSNTKQIEIDFGTSTTVDYIILGNFRIPDDDYDIIIYYYSGGYIFDSVHSFGSTTDASNVKMALSQARTASKFRLDLAPASPAKVEIACIFLGEEYSTPVNYQYHNDLNYFVRNNVEYDMHGYPYGINLDLNEKLSWDVLFHFTKSQLSNFKEQLMNCLYNIKPFFLYDTNVDTNYHLCISPESNLNAVNQAADFYEVNFKAIEL